MGGTERNSNGAGTLTIAELMAGIPPQASPSPTRTTLPTAFGFTIDVQIDEQTDVQTRSIKGFTNLGSSYTKISTVTPYS